MPKCPYTFPHRTRRAMTDYILNRCGRSYYGVHYPFAWDVKAWAADFDGDSLRARAPEYDLDPGFDPDWESYVDSDDRFFWDCCEDAARDVSEGEWTSYPGDDQGDWEFSFAGRSGGWLVLEKWRGWNMRGADAETFAEMDLPTLKAFYRGIRCADSDFTPAKAAAEVEYQAAFRRHLWEADKRAEKAAEIAGYVAGMYEARPDLAPQWEGARE